MRKKCTHLIDYSQNRSNKTTKTIRSGKQRLYLANTQKNMTQSFTDGF